MLLREQNLLRVKPQFVIPLAPKLVNGENHDILIVVWIWVTEFQYFRYENIKEKHISRAWSPVAQGQTRNESNLLEKPRQRDHVIISDSHWSKNRSRKQITKIRYDLEDLDWMLSRNLLVSSKMKFNWMNR